MLDSVRLLSENQYIINHLHQIKQLKKIKPPNRNYISFELHGNKLRMDFRKVYEKGKIIGFRSASIIINPHYHSNNYLHNGNDLTPNDCIKSIREILISLGISEQDYTDLKVVNIEFGVNIIPSTDIKEIINGIFLHKKTMFTTPNIPFYKITNASKFKFIKCYAKGLQFEDNPNCKIHPNTLRVEVKSKESKHIRNYGIETVLDLLELDTYYRLSQQLINEWDYVLLINQTPDLKDIKPDNTQYEKVEFWNDLMQEKHRNSFLYNKEKYYKNLGSKNNLHREIKLLMIDKLFQFSNCADSTPRTMIDAEITTIKEKTSLLINLESAQKEEIKKENEKEKLNPSTNYPTIEKRNHFISR